MFGDLLSEKGVCIDRLDSGSHTKDLQECSGTCYQTWCPVLPNIGTGITTPDVRYYTWGPVLPHLGTGITTLRDRYYHP